MLADNQDIELLQRLYRVIVEEGTSYPHHRFPEQDAFMDYWFRGKSTVAAYVPDRAHTAGMVGVPDCRSKGQPALFMTVRREIAQSPSETGARSREGGRHT